MGKDFFNLLAKYTDFCFGLTDSIPPFAEKLFGLYVTFLHIEFFIYRQKMRQFKISEEERVFFLYWLVMRSTEFT